jgi:hypothetical protein
MRALVDAGRRRPSYRPSPTVRRRAAATLTSAEMSGYMLVPVDRVPEAFNAGFSLYAAAWPLLERHPGSRFQSGLFGTLDVRAVQTRSRTASPIHPDKPKDMYSDIEGGLGWWRDTRFPTATPKFIMGGVAPDFAAWANGPGAGKGRDWERPLGKYAIAQLSPWVVWPPDGLNLAQGTCGELLRVRLRPAAPRPRAARVGESEPATGDRCWTLFLNTTNFKGPLAFFTPNFWFEHAMNAPNSSGNAPRHARIGSEQGVPNGDAMDPRCGRRAVAGRGDVRRASRRRRSPSTPKDARSYSHRLHVVFAPRRSPTPSATGSPEARRRAGRSIRRADRSYSLSRRAADPRGNCSPTEPDKRRLDPISIWKAVRDADGRMTRRRTATLWNAEVVKAHRRRDRTIARSTSRVLSPRWEAWCARGTNPRWTAVATKDVPSGTGLGNARLQSPRGRDEGAYVTPEAPESPFKKPGPGRGPVRSHTRRRQHRDLLVVPLRATQPAMVMSGLSDGDRREAQRRVELLHRTWTKDRTYLAPPTTGTLAGLRPGAHRHASAGLRDRLRSDRRPAGAPSETATRVLRRFDGIAHDQWSTDVRIRSRRAEEVGSTHRTSTSARP